MRPVTWTPTRWPLDLELAPTHRGSARPGWLVKRACAKNKHVRKGMRLISVNGLDPSGWSHAQILINRLRASGMLPIYMY